MNSEDIRKQFVERLGLRIGSQTAAYVVRQLQTGHAFPVLGADARSGAPVRTTVDPVTLLATAHDVGPTRSTDLDPTKGESA